MTRPQNDVVYFVVIRSLELFRCLAFLTSAAKIFSPECRPGCGNTHSEENDIVENVGNNLFLVDNLNPKP